MAAPGEANPSHPRRARCVMARAGGAEERPFTTTFLIGSAPECGVRIAAPGVAPRHVQVLRDGIAWWIRNLAGPGRALVDGAPVQFVPLEGEAEVHLGKGGPIVSLKLAEQRRAQGQPDEAAPERAGDSGGREQSERPPAQTSPRDRPPPAAGGGELSEAEIIQRYLRPVGDAPAGKQTLMFRAAFQRVQRRASRRYHVVIAAILLVLLTAAGVIAYQRQKLRGLQASAERFFYSMKALEVRTAQLEELVLASAAPEAAAALGEGREKLRQMEAEYDAFVRELGVYGKVTERQRHVLRVARRFGECEVNVPGEFVSEVEHYIERWRQNPRLAAALRRAKQHGYGLVITRAFAQASLPPQYVYLALQESAFDERAVGTPTRYGFAKGMWQFISLTGHRYGLRIGPLYEQAVYDPQDERFDWPKATRAAVQYIRKLTATDAQGSGLLVMASYNWGEDKVRAIIASLPENPRERNFWQLLAHRQVPKETYDYVLSIVSAAVICENPSLFGFDLECPIPPQPRIDELGRDRAG